MKLVDRWRSTNYFNNMHIQDKHFRWHTDAVSFAQKPSSPHTYTQCDPLEAAQQHTNTQTLCTVIRLARAGYHATHSAAGVPSLTSDNIRIHIVAKGGGGAMERVECLASSKRTRRHKRCQRADCCSVPCGGPGEHTFAKCEMLLQQTWTTRRWKSMNEKYETEMVKTKGRTKEKRHRKREKCWKMENE